MQPQVEDIAKLLGQLSETSVAMKNHCDAVLQGFENGLHALKTDHINFKKKAEEQIKELERLPQALEFTQASAKMAHESISNLKDSLSATNQSFMNESSALRGDIRYLIDHTNKLENQMIQLQKDVEPVRQALHAIDLRFNEIKELIFVIVNRGNDAMEKKMQKAIADAKPADPVDYKPAIEDVRREIQTKSESIVIDAKNAFLKASNVEAQFSKFQKQLDNISLTVQAMQLKQ